MKKLLALLLALLMMLSLAACAKDEAPADDAADAPADDAADAPADDAADAPADDAADYTYKVGFVTYADDDSSIQAMVETLKAGLESDELRDAIGAPQNIEYLQVDGKADGATQQAGVENLLTQDVDIILMYGASMPSNTNCVKACNDAGVPMILVGSDATEGDYFYVGFQDKDLGIRQGEFIAANLKENGKVCYLQGAPEQENAQNRMAGTLETLEELRPDIEILSCQTGNWQSEEAMRVTEDWIQAYDEIDCIVVGDNKMTQGVAQALKAADMIEDVLVVGVIHLGSWDADMIKNGDMGAGIYVGFPVLGDFCVEAVKDIYLEGKTGERVNIDMYDITADNYSEYFG